MSDSTNAYTALRFNLEVSARYHDYRRATLEARVTLIRLVSLLGSVLSLLAVSHWVESKETMIQAVAIISAVVGLVNLVDLVFHFDADARVHTSVFQRYKALLADMARHQGDWEKRTPEWEAEAQAIRGDEPPTYWALYALAWNQTLEKNDIHTHRRPLSWWQRLAANWKQFRPDQFRPA
jgi:hypothetical protein